MTDKFRSLIRRLPGFNRNRSTVSATHVSKWSKIQASSLGNLGQTRADSSLSTSSTSTLDQADIIDVFGIPFNPKLITAPSSISTTTLASVNSSDASLMKLKAATSTTTTLNTRDSAAPIINVKKNGSIYELLFHINPGVCVSLAQLPTMYDAKMVQRHKIINILREFQVYFQSCRQQFLLTKICDLLLCYRDNPQWSVAHFAAYFNYVQYFQNEPDVEELEDQNNPDRWSPLHIAVSVANLQIIHLMLNTGMDVFQTDSRQWTACHFAMLTTPKVIDSLIVMPAFYQQLRHLDVNGLSPMLVGCLAGNTRNLQRVMMQGVTIRQLILSAPKPLNAGANLVNWHDDPTPYIKFTEQELDKDFDWNLIQYCGNPLHWCKSWTMLNRLLKLKEFRVNQKNMLGDTPLIIYVNIPLPGGASLSLVRRSMKRIRSPLRGTRKKRWGKNKSSRQKPSLFAPSENSSPLSSVIVGNSSTISTALTDGASNTIKTIKTATTLPPTINYRLSWLLRLITAGAHVNAQNELGNTALHYAVTNGYTMTVQLLIVFGARINLRNNAKQSPLHLASVRLQQLSSESSFGQKLLNRTWLMSSQSKYRLNQIDIYKNIILLLNQVGARKCRIFSLQSNITSECSEHCRSSKTQPRSSSSSKSESLRSRSSSSKQRKSKSNKGKKSKEKTKTKKRKKKKTLSLDENLIHDSQVMFCLDLKNQDSEKIEDLDNLSLIPRVVLTLDGGLNDSFINPLIQVIHLNELQRYLKHPLADYFDGIYGTSFGFTNGCSLATGHPLLEAFQLFLELRNNFRKPMIKMQQHNTVFMEEELKNYFSDNITLDRVHQLLNKHLILTTALVDIKPSRLRLMDHREQPKLTMWKACRITGMGIGLYKGIEHEGKPYYDGSFVAPNPTFDSLAYNHWLMMEKYGEKIRAKRLHPCPINLVVSIGGGKEQIQTSVEPIDLVSLVPYDVNIRNYFNFFRQLRNWMVHSLLETDGWVMERSRYFAKSVKINFARLNTHYDKQKAKQNLATLEKLQGQAWETNAKDQLRLNQLLVNILWDVKVQLYFHRSKLRRLAKFLEHHRSLVVGRKSSNSTIVMVPVIGHQSSANVWRRRSSRSMQSQHSVDKNLSPKMLKAFTKYVTNPKTRVVRSFKRNIRPMSSASKGRSHKQTTSTQSKSSQI